MSESKKSKAPTFKQPRILADGESNLIRGKILAGDASKSEILQLIGHFDLVDQKLRGALEALRSCMPARVYIWEGPEETRWSSVEPETEDGLVETIDFAKLLDGLETA